MSPLEEYKRRLRTFAVAVSPYLDPDDGALISDLIEHNEGGEALLTLAWILIEDDLRLPVDLIRDIRTLTTGLIDPTEFPPDLDRHAL